MSDWEPKQKCTNCGSSHIREVVIQDEYVYHSDGEVQFSGAGDTLATVLHVCDECEQELDRMDDEDILELIR